MARKKHKNKEIEEALQYAEQHGWSVEVHLKSKSHTWGVMKCESNSSICWNGLHCSTSIWSTPRNAHNHASQIKKIVDKCIYNKDDANE